MILNGVGPPCGGANDLELQIHLFQKLHLSPDAPLLRGHGTELVHKAVEIGLNIITGSGT